MVTTFSGALMEAEQKKDMLAGFPWEPLLGLAVLGLLAILLNSFFSEGEKAVEGETLEDEEVEFPIGEKSFLITYSYTEYYFSTASFFVRTYKENKSTMKLVNCLNKEKAIDEFFYEVNDAGLKNVAIISIIEL